METHLGVDVLRELQVAVLHSAFTLLEVRHEAPEGEPAMTIRAYCYQCLIERKMHLRLGVLLCGTCNEPHPLQKMLSAHSESDKPYATQWSQYHTSPILIRGTP